MRAYFFFLITYFFFLLLSSHLLPLLLLLSALSYRSHILSHILSLLVLLCVLLSVFYLIRCSSLLYRISTASVTAIRSLFSSPLPLVFLSLSLSQDYFALFSKSVILPSVSSVVHELSTYCSS